MAADDELVKQVEALATSAHETVATLIRNPRSTVAPPRDVRTGRRALEVLKTLQHDAHALVPESILGQGGMGVVKLARQVALDRAVAVKTLKGAPVVDDVEALLGEAWLAGALEHPSILPIYSLSLDVDGRPQVVMKRIEGVTWSKLLTGEADRAVYAPARTALESHLKIALQVCNAVHFAHSRGVIHRDLKPDNVMVGSFGEVYLVDWGIATSPGPSTQLAGTPAYMAPEMLGNGGEIGVATDIYLLGSVLSEVLTGRAPHSGNTPRDMLTSVLASSPVLPGDAPIELVELVKRCMARNPVDRPKTALEVRHALELFLEHQGSRELVEQSQLRAKELLAALGDRAPDAIQVSRLFSECRFGFEQALRIWPENEAARSALFAITSQMVRFELEHGSLRQAETLLAELNPPPPELALAVERARNDELHRAEELERLHRLAESLDPLTGSAARVIIVFVLGFIWAAAPLTAFFVLQHQPLDEILAPVPITLLSLATLIGMAWKTPRSRWTPLNEKIAHVLFFALGTQTLGLVYARVALPDSGPHMVATLLAFWGVIIGSIASALAKEVSPSAIIFALGAASAIAWPHWRYLIGASTNAALMINISIVSVWQRRQLAARARVPRTP